MNSLVDLVVILHNLMKLVVDLIDLFLGKMWVVNYSITILFIILFLAFLLNFLFLLAMPYILHNDVHFLFSKFSIILLCLSTRFSIIVIFFWSNNTRNKLGFHLRCLQFLKFCIYPYLIVQRLAQVYFLLIYAYFTATNQVSLLIRPLNKINNKLVYIRDSLL